MASLHSLPQRHQQSWPLPSYCLCPCSIPRSSIWLSQMPPILWQLQASISSLAVPWTLDLSSHPCPKHLCLSMWQRLCTDMLRLPSKPFWPPKYSSGLHPSRLQVKKPPDPATGLLIGMELKIQNRTLLNVTSAMTVLWIAIQHEPCQSSYSIPLFKLFESTFPL